MVVPREDNMEIAKFKGLNTFTRSDLIDDAEFCGLTNFEFGDQAELKKRTGLQLVTDFTNVGGWTNGKEIKYLGSFPAPPDNTLQFCTVAGQPYYVQAPAIGINWTKVAGIPDGTYCVGMTSFNDVWYFLCRNNGGIYKATPAINPTASAVAGAPKVEVFVNFKGRLWVVEPNPDIGNALSNTIKFSESYNFEDWQPDNINIVDPNMGDVITNLVPYSDRIIVFKKFSIWNMYLQGNDFPISATRLLTSTRGAISTESIVTVNDLIYFIAADGVWRTDGNAFSELSKPISNAWIGRSIDWAFDETDWIAYNEGHLKVRLQTGGGGEIPDESGGQLHMQTYSDATLGLRRSYFFSYSLAADAWSEEIFPIDVIGGLTRPKAGRNQGSPVFMQGGIDRLFQRQQEITYWKDDTHYVTAAPAHMNSVPVVTSFATKRYNIGNISRVKRLKYAMVGLQASRFDSGAGNTVGFSSPGSTPTFWYTVDGIQRESFSFDPFTVTNLGAFKIPGTGYFRTFQLSMTESDAQFFTIHFLHFIMHLKRQLAESPR